MQNWRNIDFTGKAKRLNKSVRARYPERKKIGKIHARDLREICKKANGKCVSCSTSDDLTFDHIVPLSAGGFNLRCNLQLLCRSCNQDKGARHPERIGALLAEQRKELARQKALRQDKRRASKALRNPPAELLGDLVHEDFQPLPSK